MFDMSHLIELSDTLEASINDKDIENIQSLCEENNTFIHSLRVLPNDPQGNEQLKRFIILHRSAIQLLTAVHVEMQNQLYQSNKTRKGVKKYKGVKNAE